MIKGDYTNSHIDSNKPSDRPSNEEWMEKTESFNLDNLFEDNSNNKDPSDRPSNHEWMEKTETFNLDNLFIDNSNNTSNNTCNNYNTTSTSTSIKSSIESRPSTATSQDYNNSSLIYKMVNPDTNINKEL